MGITQYRKSPQNEVSSSNTWLIRENLKPKGFQTGHGPRACLLENLYYIRNPITSISACPARLKVFLLVSFAPTARVSTSSDVSNPKYTQSPPPLTQLAPPHCRLPPMFSGPFRILHASHCGLHVSIKIFLTHQFL
ncbi:hypothetical protein LXL04_006812 [Taraxacum kok-saghyz]